MIYMIHSFASIAYESDFHILEQNAYLPMNWSFGLWLRLRTRCFFWEHPAIRRPPYAFISVWNWYQVQRLILASHRAARNLVLALVEGRYVLHIASVPISQTGTGIEGHVHQRSVRDPALEILDEVHEPSSVNPLENYYNPEKLHSFQSPGWDLEQFNKRNQIIFIDHSFFSLQLR
jgi:hypothetical protein